jgi:exonuclease SbcD
MRLLHTGDWHVGRLMRGRSRLEEHRAVLAEVVAVAAERDVDLVVVAGDLFDVASPPPEAEGLVYQALLDLAGDRRHVVVVAGNHDSPRRLKAVAPLAGLGRVHVAPFVVPPGRGGLDEVVVRSGDAVRVAALPWLSKRYVVTADALLRQDADQHQLAYQERMGAVVAALCAPFRTGAVNLVVGHVHALGGLLGGGERSAHTVLDYAVPATVFPASAGYVALGHLHRAQRIPGPAPTWYSGSPLQLDFGEEADDKAALIVDVAPDAPAAVEVVPLRAGRRLRTLVGSMAELAALAPPSGERSEGGEEWLRVVVAERSRPGLADDVRQLFPDVVDVRVAPPDADAVEAGGADRPSRLGRSPGQLFDDYLADRGVDDARLTGLFGELFEIASAEEREAETTDAA